MSTDKENFIYSITRNIGKARRLKQAKDEATEEIEKYRNEREKQFKEFESKVSIKIIYIKNLTSH